jgi:hypothetical protein
MTQNRPQTGDYALDYGKYIALVPGGDFLATLASQLRDTSALLSPLTDSEGEFRYAPGKWSIKEILGHVNDAERIFSYRMLRIARGDQTPLPGFEQDDYVKTGNFGARRLSDLLEEFGSIRQATIALARSLDTAAWLRRGVASQNEVTALALAFIIAGHERHHSTILRDRYIPAVPRP